MNLVTVEMGRCTFRAPEVPMTGPAADAVAVPLDVDGERLTVTAVSVGNPHCVIFADRLDEALVRRLGPKIEHHPAFPNRINVQWAKVASRSEVEIMIWERGAGWTLASGSSSSAVACAAVRNGLCDHGLVTVRMPGGTLYIEVRPDWSIRLQGPVEEVYTGAFSRDLTDALAALNG
jgi:diaminopimelate epimerase